MLVLKTSLGSATRERISSEQQKPVSHPAREKVNLLLFESKGLIERYATLSEQVILVQTVKYCQRALA